MIDNTRGLWLGRRGEEAWGQLRAAYQTHPSIGAACALIIADSAETRAEVRRRLDALGVVHARQPRADVLDDIHARATPGSVPIIWLEAPPLSADVGAWEPALLALNRGRDLLGDRGPVFLVLAGDRALHELLSVQAPDLASVLNPKLVFDQSPQALAELSGPLCWMHLSDLHIRTHDWEQDIVLRALARDLPDLLEQTQRKVDLLFVTGDIANSGKKEEYEAAGRFFEQLCTVLHLDLGRVFVVPGNHDVERHLIGTNARLAQKAIRGEKHDARRRIVGELLGNPDEMDPHGMRLREFCAFTQRFLPARGVRTSRPFRTDVEVIQGVSVGIASLCTAWLSGPETDGKGDIVLGARQVHDIADELDKHGAQLEFALLHHPLEWLDDSEAGEVRRLLRERFDVVLHGHLHQRDARVEDDGSNHIVSMGAGAAYDAHAGERWLGFFLGQLDDNVEIDAFTYTSQAGRWHPDASFGRAGETRRTLTFVPKQLTKRAATIESQPDVLAAQLRAVLARVHATLAFTGFPRTGSWPSATLPEVFVAPHVSPSEHRSNSEFPRAEFVTNRRKHHADLGPAARIVVLGGPGSGKSTFCKHLALEAATADEGPVPLLLTMRAWDLDEHGILSHAARLAGRMLSKAVDEAALAQLCEAGRIVLIIDGVDEAGPAARTILRDNVVGFAEIYPRVPILVTSRILGYDEVRFAEFDHWTIPTFDNDQIRQFIKGWYAVAEQPLQKAESRAIELLDALDAVPPIKELARTPLLATLIAALHLHQGALPGRRADVFERCIELLVDSWPRDRRRTLTELPGYWQIEALGVLALQMQRRRSERNSVYIALDGMTLECELDGLLRHRILDGAERHDLARRWLAWLVDANVLVEERHDSFSFFHLSLMEYLAGQAVLAEQIRGGHAQVITFVTAHYHHTPWKECLLLMIGSRAMSRELRDDVITALIAIRPVNSEDGLFLLTLLDDADDVDDNTRDELLAAAARATLVGGLRPWQKYRAAMANLLRFEARHGAAIKRWLEHQLDTRRGEQLLAILWMAPSDLAEFRLAQREPDELELLPILELGQADDWGSWARTHARPDTVLEWIRTGALRGALSHALASLTSSNDESSMWIIGLQRRMCWLGRQSGAITSSIQWHSASCEFEATTVPALQCGILDHAPQIVNSAYLMTALWDLDLETVIKIQLMRGTPLPEWTHRKFSRFFSTRWSEANLGALMPSLSDEPDPSRLAKSLVQFGRKIYSSDIPTSLVTPSLLSVCVPNRARPDTSDQRWMDARLPPEIHETWPMVVAFFASFHAGARGASDPNTAHIVGEAYVQNLSINLFFDALVEIATSTDGDLSSNRQALLLALGLAQYQTTWRWPVSSHWQRWFGAPPEHWLSAHVWHLCWAVAEPHDPQHLERAHACLDRGGPPEMVAALREHPIIPTTHGSHCAPSREPPIQIE